MIPLNPQQTTRLDEAKATLRRATERACATDDPVAFRNQLARAFEAYHEAWTVSLTVEAEARVDRWMNTLGVNA